MSLLAAVFATFAYGLMSPILGVLLPTYTLNPAQQGSLGLTNALGAIIASLATGPLVDLKGPKTAMLLGLTLMAASLFGMPNAVGYAGLLTVYFILGVGGGIVSTGSNSLVAAIRPETRGPALNFLNLFFGLGGILTTYAASYLFKPLTVCYVIASVTMAALITNALAPALKSLGASFRWAEVPRLFSRPGLALLALSMFLYVACEVGVWTWLKAYLISIHFEPRTAGGIVSYGFALGILIGRLVVARVLIYVSARNLLLASSILIALTTFAMLHVSSRLGVTLAVFSAGLAMAPVFPTTLALVADNFPYAAATAIGLAITSGWFGLAVSSPLIGRWAATSSLQQALLLLPTLASAMVLVNLVLRRYRGSGAQA